MTNTAGQRTLESLLRPYKTMAIAEAAGVARQAVSAWRNGQSIPDVRALPPLAEFLKIDLGELTAIIATEARPRGIGGPRAEVA